MQRKKKWLTASITAIMLISLVSPASAADNNDHWAAASIAKWKTYGVISGYPDGSFRPDQSITRAEFVKIVNTVFGFYAPSDRSFADVPPGAWYAKDLSVAKQAGYYEGFPGGAAKAETKISRQDAVTLLARVFALKSAEGANISFTDREQMKPYAWEAIHALQGVVSGYEDGSFRPNDNITRAEVVTLLDKMLSGYYAKAGSFSAKSINGNAIINHSGVELKDTVVEGNLYLSAGIGDGEVTLDHVTVEGTTFIAGGGTHSILVNDSQLGEVNVNRKEGKVRLHASGATMIGTVTLDSESKLELGEGTIAKNVVVNQPAELAIDDGASIDELKIGEAAGGTTVEAKGDIGKAVIEANGVKVNGKATSKGEIKVTGGGTPVSPAPTTGGGGSSPDTGTPSTVLASYMFNSDVQGFAYYGEYQAAFGDPKVFHTTALGNGMLGMNAVLSSSAGAWQELKVVKSVSAELLSKVKKISFDLYMDASLLETQGAKIIKPYVVAEPGTYKIGLDEIVAKTSEMERVELGGKTYAKLSTVYYPVTASMAGKTELTLNFVSTELNYVGPIYIDNVKLDSQGLVKPTTPPGVAPNHNQSLIDTAGFDLSPINLVDRDATAQTKSLFAYMKNISGDYMLFGQQHATTQGLTIDKFDGTQSDVNNSVGAFPAIYGWDTLSIEGKEEPGSTSMTSEQNIEALAKVMKMAYDRGGILALSSHMPNFETGKGFNEPSSGAVSSILPGGEKHEEYKAFLDNIAALAHEVKDDEGNAIPIIFRPFHEHTGSWFWWGASWTTDEEYVNLFRFTVDYLRETKDVHNFLYAFSPNGLFDGNQDRYLYRYPGDEYIDILGYDVYGGATNPNAFYEGVAKDAAMIAGLAAEKGKIPALTEIGLSGGMLKENNPNKTWWTGLLNTLKETPEANKMAYLMTWRNGSLNEFWVPFHNHLRYDNSDMLDDFIRFYNDGFTAFGDRLQNVYDLSVNTTAETPFAYVVTPTEGMKLKNDKLKLRVATRNGTVDSVTYSVYGSTEAPLTLNNTSGFWEAEWTPTAELNGKEVPVTVKVAFNGGTTMTKTTNVQLYVPNLTVREFAFDSPADMNYFSYDGAWKADVGTPALAYNEERQALQVNADISGANVTETWQELKLKFDDLQTNVSMKDVNQVQFDLLLSKALYQSQDQNAVTLMPKVVFDTDWGKKYDAVPLNKKLSELQEVTVGDAVYGKFSVTIPLTDDAKESANTMLISLVSSQLSYTGPIFVDNIRFVSSIDEPAADPTQIDNFEAYNGDSTKLSVYSKNGDSNTLTLSGTEKSSGEYGLRYDYSLGSQGYTGIIKPLGYDWSPFSQLDLWMKPDGKGQLLVLQITAGGVEYEKRSTELLAGTTAQTLSIPLNEFLAKGTQAPLEGAALKDIQKFSIYINAINGAQLSSTLYFDDIKVSGTSDGETGGGKGGTGPAAAMPPFEFESGVDGWAANQTAVATDVSADWAASGSKSLKATVTAGGNVEIFRQGAQDFTGKTALKANVNIAAAGTYSAKLYIKTGSGWTWKDGGAVTVQGNTPTQLNFNLTGVTELDAIQSIGIEFNLASGTGATDIYVDHVIVE